MDYIIYLVIIAFVIILSELSLYISKRFGIEGTLLVPLFVGFILKALFTKDNLSIDLSELTPIFLAIAGVSLIFFVFDSSAKLGIKNMDTSHSNAFRLFLVTFLLNMSVLTFFIVQLSGVNILSAMIFSLVFTGTAPIFFNDFSSKARDVLSKETLIATPILFLLGYFIYDQISIKNGISHFFAPSLSPYILELIIGAGAGVAVTIVFFNTIRRFYRGMASRVMTILTAVCAYVLAEFLGGDGVIASAVFALFFGSMHVANKEKTTILLEKIITPMLIILILILGFTVGLSIGAKIFFDSIVLLLIMLMLRFASASLVFWKNHTLKEKLHVTLNTGHGASLIIILLLLALRGFTETAELVQISMLLLIYTALISIAASLYDHKRISAEKEQTI